MRNVSALRALVKNPIKESFYGESKKKKQLMFWQFFSFPIKVMSPLFVYTLAMTLYYPILLCHKQGISIILDSSVINGYKSIIAWI